MKKIIIILYILTVSRTVKLARLFHASHVTRAVIFEFAHRILDCFTGFNSLPYIFVLSAVFARSCFKLLVFRPLYVHTVIKRGKKEAKGMVLQLYTLELRDRAPSSSNLIESGSHSNAWFGGCALSYAR